MKRVAVIGPESTGKSTLCEQLSHHFHSPWVPEYARKYIERLERPYTYEDVEQIAMYQVEELSIGAIPGKPFIFYDTELIITKVWFLHHYKKMPSWLDEAIKGCDIAHYLLCYPDLPWEYDPLRENPEIREELFEWYRREVEALGIPYTIVRGDGTARTEQAIEALNQIMKNSTTE